jgi:hypothetical protein
MERRGTTHCLDEDEAMESVDGVPRCVNSEGDIGGLAVEEGVVDVVLEICGSEGGGADGGIHG